MMGIYGIKLADEIVYIGQSRNISRRIANHRSYMAKGDERHENRYLCRACAKYGIDAFEFFVVEQVDDFSALTRREQYWIRAYDFPKGNYIIPTATDDWTVSDEFISQYLMGENNPNYGHFWSEEQKRALSQKVSGTRIGKNNANYGNRSEKNPMTKHLCPYSMDELIDALTEHHGFVGLSKALGVPRAAVQRWCRDFGIPYKRRDYDDFGLPTNPFATREQMLCELGTIGVAGIKHKYAVNNNAVDKWRRELDIFIPKNGADTPFVDADSLRRFKAAFTINTLSEMLFVSTGTLYKMFHDYGIM